MSHTEPVAALNLDFKQQGLFVSFYNTLPEKPPSTVRFFSHSDYYTVHGPDDTSLASSFTANITKHMGDEDAKLSYLVLRKSQFEQFIRHLLLVKHYRVEVYVKESPNKINQWRVEYKGSPGNLSQFEEILGESAHSGTGKYVMAMKIIRTGHLAVGCVSAGEMKMKVCEFQDNECFTELETLLAQIGPSECLIPIGDNVETTNLRKVLERNSVFITPLKRSLFTFNRDVMIQDLNRLLFFFDGQQRSCATFKEVNLTEAMGCLGAVINFLNLIGSESNYNQYRLGEIEAHTFLRLDKAALYSLNILPKTNKDFSLLNVLDNCTTNQGKRLLEQWIKHPLRDLNLIDERLDIVECFVKMSELRQTLQSDVLTRLPDLLHLSKKISGRRSTLQDCYKVYQIVTSISHLLELLDKTKNPCVKSLISDPLSELNADLDKYKQMIEELVDFDLADRGEFLVRRDFDDAIREVYDKKARIEERMQRALRDAASDLGFAEDKTIKLECNNQHGYFFRVTLKEEHALRRNSRYEILDAVKGGVRFTNRKLGALNDDRKETMDAYEEAQKTVLAEVLEVAAGYGDTLRSINLHVATVDVLISFANAAVNARIPYVRPKLFEPKDGAPKVLRFSKLRHPCVEQQEHVSFIPNDVDFDRTASSFQIITGPNMCGKSTFIRSVGVGVLMAQIGSFVPCASAEITLVDAILARVGAEDCQLNGLSTFMLEMIETSSILKTSTKDSLVIIDELGRGTSTYDGCGIAFAIAEHLAKDVGCFSMFATHFHEIARLADSCDNVTNLHVTAVTTNDTITPLYQIRPGPCDNSYGIHCARMVGFPDDVIEGATEYQKQLEISSGNKFLKDVAHGLKRPIIEEGNRIIRATLRQLKSDAEHLTDDELSTAINRLLEKDLASGNEFVKGLLSD